MKYRLEAAPNVHKEVAQIYLYREKNQGKGSGSRFLEALTECYKAILAIPLAIRSASMRTAMRHCTS